MSGTSLKSVSTHTDAAGKFAFDSMPFAFGMLMIEKPGLARTMVKAVDFAKPCKVDMEKAATVSGSIADDQGKAPAGVWVNVCQTDLFLDFRASIEPDGSFKVEDLPPGKCIVMAYKNNRGTQHEVFRVEAGRDDEVDWDAQGSAIIQGRVLQNGKPVPHAEITVYSSRPGINWEDSAESGTDGSYKLSVLDPGKYSMSVHGRRMDGPEPRAFRQERATRGRRERGRFRAAVRVDLGETGG